jgi:shikimate dehydrogenase
LQVSRFPSQNKALVTYRDLAERSEILEQYHLIVNTTPLGTHPNTEEMPEINTDWVNESHCVYDLVYNPEKTLLMRTLEAKGAKVKNGLEMLSLQAEAAWKIWN